MNTGHLIKECEQAVDRATGKRAIHTTVARVQLGFGMSPETYDRLVVTAKECGVTLAEFCRQAVNVYMDVLDSVEPRQ